MRVLYGVNGEGMGHATRSQVVIESLLERHEVRVVASGAAFDYLSGVLPDVEEILGAKFAMEDGEIRRWATVRQNVSEIGSAAPSSIRRWIEMTREWRPDVVVTDFEPLSAIYARAARTPLIAVDNINMLDRCLHDAEIVDGQREDFMIARAVTRSMVPNAVNYIVTTFFYPPLAKGRRRWCRRSCGRRSSTRSPSAASTCVVYSSGEESAARRAARERGPLPRLRHARRPGRGHDATATSSSGRAPTTGSSRICGPRGASSPAAASRCSARRSTSASRCWRSRCAASSSS